MFKGSRARDCFVGCVRIPCYRLECSLPTRIVIVLAASRQSLMAAPMSHRLCCSLIIFRASCLAPYTFAYRAYSPSAALVCARERSRRLRFGLLLASAIAYVHATQKTCTVRLLPFLSRSRPSRRRSQRNRAYALVSLLPEPHSDHNEILQSRLLAHSRWRF
jgi:hypothetical protein